MLTTKCLHIKVIVRIIETIKKYYLICYCANNKENFELINFNEVIYDSPVYFLNNLIEEEQEKGCRYKNHILTMVHEITKEEFDFFKANF